MKLNKTHSMKLSKRKKENPIKKTARCLPLKNIFNYRQTKLMENDVPLKY